MKKIFKGTFVVLLVLALTACGSNLKKSFQDKLEVALLQLAEANSFKVNATLDAGVGSSFELELSAKDVQEDLKMYAEVNAIGSGAPRDSVMKMFIVDGVIYSESTLFAPSKSKAELDEYSTYEIDPKSLSSSVRTFLTVFDVEGEDKESSGDITYRLKFNEKALETIIDTAESQIGEGLAGIPMENMFEGWETLRFEFTFGEDGNLKEILVYGDILVGSEIMELEAKIEVSKINEEVEFEIPSTDGY